MKKPIVIIVGAGSGEAGVTTISDIINDHRIGIDAITIVVDEVKEQKELLNKFRKLFDSKEFEKAVLNEPPLDTLPELYREENHFNKKTRGNKYGHSKFF